MTFVAILLALLAARLMPGIDSPERPFVLSRYVRALRQALPGEGWWVEWPAVLLVLVPPVLGVWWLERHLPYPFGWLLMATAVLWLCLGPRDPSSELRRLIAARERGDAEGAQRILRRLQRGPESGEPSRRSMVGSMFIHAHERLFGVLLWFMLFGPAGALFYRLVSQLPLQLQHADHIETPGERFAEILHGLAAWIPVRITALLYGLAGSLDDALKAWRGVAQRPDHGWRSQTWAVLAETAGGSLQSEADDGAAMVPASLDALLREVLALERRTLLILLAFYAFFTTGLWLH